MQVFGVCSISRQDKGGGELEEARPTGEGLALQPLPILGGLRGLVFEESEPFHRNSREQGRLCLTRRDDLDVWGQRLLSFGDFGFFILAGHVCNFAPSEVLDYLRQRGQDFLPPPLPL